MIIMTRRSKPLYETDFNTSEGWVAVTTWPDTSMIIDGSTGQIDDWWTGPDPKNRHEESVRRAKFIVACRFGEVLE